jgi:hypothetical protein
MPIVFYLHPWELDPAAPAKVRLDYRFRHYVNSGKRNIA